MHGDTSRINFEPTNVHHSPLLAIEPGPRATTTGRCLEQTLCMGHAEVALQHTSSMNSSQESGARGLRCIRPARRNSCCAVLHCPEGSRPDFHTLLAKLLVLSNTQLPALEQKLAEHSSPI